MNLKTIFYNFTMILGEFSMFATETVKSLRGIWRRRGLFLRQCEFIGVNSMGIVLFAALFMGGVLGFQLYIAFHRFGAESLLGGSVGVALFRELAPVMTAIMVTGRAGSAMAAEISSMRISEQIDALEVMAVDPIEFLITPRILAGFIMLPLLSTLFGLVGSWASAWVACGVMGLDPIIYWERFAYSVDAMDMIHCVVKGGFFGLVLTWVGCFYGYRAHGGASAVGLATRSTVVVSCLSILFTDFILTSFLPFGLGKLEV